MIGSTGVSCVPRGTMWQYIKQTGSVNKYLPSKLQKIIKL